MITTTTVMTKSDVPHLFQHKCPEFSPGICIFYPNDPLHIQSARSPDYGHRDRKGGFRLPTGLTVISPTSASTAHLRWTTESQRHGDASLRQAGVQSLHSARQED
jgi:hypothetical protein